LNSSFEVIHLERYRLRACGLPGMNRHNSGDGAGPAVQECPGTAEVALNHGELPR